MYRCQTLLFALALTSLWSGLSSVCTATPSGLNNIPTADTTPQGTVVLQGFSTLGGERDDDFNLGFKSGLTLGAAALEFGADSHLIPDNAGPVTLQAKLAMALGQGLPTVAGGVANGTFSSADANRAGEDFFYLVGSQDLGFVRAHAGAGLQDGALLPFAGFDKTFHSGASTGAGEKEAGVSSSRDLFTLRADAIQQQDSSFLFSAGVLVPVNRFFVFETWGNFPDNGDQASLTLKLNFVLSF